MDCHDIRVLLALARRGDAIDPTERAALQQHLDACSDCAALSHSEQAVDTAFGKAIRAVTVPAGLETRVLTRLALTRPRRWPKVAAAAAAVLLVIGLGTWWTLPRATAVDNAVAQQTINGLPTESEQVAAWFKERGVEMEPCKLLDSQHLWTYDVVEFQGKRVPKLIYYNRDRAAVAQVIVLQTRRFDTRELTEGFPGQTPNRIFVERESNSDFVYLIGTSAQSLEPILREGAH